MRTIEALDLSFERGREAGWHVVLGQNGAGKSSVVRSFALAMMGERDAYAAGQVFSEWVRFGAQSASIDAVIDRDDKCDPLTQGRPPSKPIELNVSIQAPAHDDSRGGAILKFGGVAHNRSVWGGGTGWFSASFGPFRRFTGGDPNYERAFLSNPRLAPHLTALSESVALREAQRWLTDMRVQSLQDSQKGGDVAKTKLSIVVDFLNQSGFFPHGARIQDVTPEHVIMTDGGGSSVSMEQMSDGYRSALSLTLELLRLMFSVYTLDQMLDFCSTLDGSILAPGVVCIDEVDAHLHPTWQRDIGTWMVRFFPRIQFIVTTHSPIVCRAVSAEDGKLRGSVWMLPRPGSGETSRKVEGAQLEKLVFGDILDAYDTRLFGQGVIQSTAGRTRREELAELNREELRRDLTADERLRLEELREAFPSISLSVAHVEYA